MHDGALSKLDKLSQVVCTMKIGTIMTITILVLVYTKNVDSGSSLLDCRVWKHETTMDHSRFTL